MSHLLKNLIIALGVTLLLGVLYFVFVREGTPEEGPAASQGKSEATRETEKMLSDIQELKKYELDGTLFTSRPFGSLRDYRIDLPVVAEGRDNPFAPVR